ncbi:MAG: FadR/GntR family transcriptional regulator [Betaproteobacteria bacterium]
MALQIVETQRLYRQIADQLRSAIKAKEWAVGERLPAERDLARQLGVSRPSVREALIALEVEGYVEVRTGSGVYVREGPGRMDTGPAQAHPSEWGPLELIRARRVLEGEIAAIAATSAKRKDIAAMAQAIASMRSDAANGILPLQGDREFHSAVVQACGNSVLIDTVQRFWDARRGPMFERMVDHFETPQSWNAAIAEHDKIITAIRAHDSVQARAAMHDHMDRSHTRFNVSWRHTRRTRTTTP